MKMPRGYRLTEVMVGGTGMGDERFVVVLQKFERRTIRKGFWPFRRSVSVLDWWTVESFDNGGMSPSLQEMQAARRSAWERHWFDERVAA